MPSPDGTAAGPAALARVIGGVLVLVTAILVALMALSSSNEAIALNDPGDPGAFDSVVVAEVHDGEVTTELLGKFVEAINQLGPDQILYLDVSRVQTFAKDIDPNRLGELASRSDRFAIEVPEEAGSTEEARGDVGEAAAVLLALAERRVAEKSTLDSAVELATSVKDKPLCNEACKQRLGKVVEDQDNHSGRLFPDLPELLRGLNSTPNTWASVVFVGEAFSAEFTVPQMPLATQSTSPSPSQSQNTKGGSDGGPGLSSILLALLVVVMAVLAVVYYRSRRDEPGGDSGGMGVSDGLYPPYRARYADPTARSHRAGAGAGAIGAGRARRSLADDADQPLSSLSTASGNRLPERAPERHSRPASRESTPVCRLFTELDPDGYVDYDGVLYRAWWDGSEEPPAVGDPVRLEDRGTGVYYAVRQS